MNYSIAIDGPAASGKSTIARGLAKKTGLVYVNTGLMYRAIGYFCLKNDIDPKDKETLKDKMNEIEISVECDCDSEKVFLNGEDVTEHLKEHGIGMTTSVISQYAFVRVLLVKIQQDIAKNQSVVMDGRDIGTKVLPGAFLKIYLTADPEVRAKRRYEEVKKRDNEASLSKILTRIKERDYEDKNRLISPLREADDAIRIDSSDMTIEEVVDKIYEIFEEKKIGYEKNHSC